MPRVGLGRASRLVLWVPLFITGAFACTDGRGTPTDPLSSRPRPEAPRVTIDRAFGTDLGTLGGSYATYRALNDAGQVVGESSIADNAQFHAFLWTSESGIQDVNDPTRTFSDAHDINALGHIVGTMTVAAEFSDAFHAFLWTPETGMRDLDVLSQGHGDSQATAVNASDQVTGSSNEIGRALHAFIWSADEGMQDLGTLGGTSSWGSDISDAGFVVGDASVTDNVGYHAFLWTPNAGMQDLGTLGGTNSHATAINNAGQVVGYSDIAGDAFFHAFLWTAETGMQDLGTLGGNYSEALAINDAGQVVGLSFIAGNLTNHGFLWTPSDGMEDLYPSTQFSQAVAINNRLQILGCCAPRALMTVQFHRNRAPVASSIDVSTVVNTAVSFTLQGADPDGDGITYAVETPPIHGVLSGTAPDLIYTAAKAYSGSDEFTYVVTDAKGLTSDPANVSVVVDLANHPPVAVPGGNNADRTAYSGIEGSPVQFDATGSTDPDGDALIFGWSFGDGNASSESKPSHSYADDGSYAAMLTADDGRGAKDTKPVIVSITNVAPTVEAPSAAAAALGANFVLAARFSDPGVNDGPWSYTIDWGDGTRLLTASTSAQGLITGSHTYNVAGDHSVVITVVDKDHGAGGARFNVAVNAPPRITSIGGPYTGTEGVPLTVTATATDLEDGNSVQYSWDFGDGSRLASGSTATHAYADNATYRVTLVVIDTKGARSEPATTTAAVANVAPSAAFNIPTSANEGSAFTLSLTNPIDAPADLSSLAYAFDCGDGRGFSASTSGSRACPTTDNGTRIVRGQVTDKDGGRTAYAATLSILNVSPVVTITSAPSSITTKSSFNLQFRFTDAGAVDNPWYYQINWGDGGKNTGPIGVASQGAIISQPYSYKKAGTYTVTVAVADKNGEVGNATARVVVR